MAHQKSMIPQDGDWRVGRRVARVDGAEFGTIMEADGEIKVKWDGGRTSYYQRSSPANIRLKDPDE